MKIFISTGEVSGDLQGALLVEALKRQAAVLQIDLEIVGFGGAKMAEAGVSILTDTTIISSIGLWESLPYILPAWLVKQKAQKYLLSHPPDVVILIDYMALNVSIGSFLKKAFFNQQLPKIPTFYYIAPQEWVWSLNNKRTTQIVGIADQILSIFPGEATYYQERGAQATFVGHPLLDRMQKEAPNRDTARQILGLKSTDLMITLLPASRQQELTYLMPVMFEAAQQIQTLLQAQGKTPQFFIPLSLEKYRSAIQAAIDHYQLQATIISTLPENSIEPHSRSASLTVLAAADLAITKSGTVNLEIALLNVPQVVIYRVNFFTAWVARHIVKFSIPFMSPPNLVQMQPIVPELLQDQATAANITTEAMAILSDPARQAQILANYGQMRTALGATGVCDRVAQIIMKQAKL